MIVEEVAKDVAEEVSYVPTIWIIDIINAELLHHRSLVEAKSDNPRQGKGINTSSCFGVERHKDSAYKISYSEVHSTSKVSDESLSFAMLFKILQ